MCPSSLSCCCALHLHKKCISYFSSCFVLFFHCSRLQHSGDSCDEAMVSCVSCQHALAWRSNTLTVTKTRQFNKQKATWNIFMYSKLVLLSVYAQLTAWQERWKVLSSWGPRCWQIGLKFLYVNSEHPGEHHGLPTQYNKKIQMWLFGSRSNSNHWSQAGFDSVSRWHWAKWTWLYGLFFLSGPCCEEDGSMVAVCGGEEASLNKAQICICNQLDLVFGRCFPPLL